jgi:hypothetical protein
MIRRMAAGFKMFAASDLQIIRHCASIVAVGGDGQGFH